MFYAKFLAAASLLTAASAAALVTPPEEPIGFEEHFVIVAEAEGAPFDLKIVSAEQTVLKLSDPTPSEGQRCSGGSVADNYGDAIFYLYNGSLWLNNPTGATFQRLMVDRSGMGQGVLQYTDNDVGVWRNAELQGWYLDDNQDLKFDQANNFLACPGGDDWGYTIWVSAGIDKPGGNEGCIRFVAHALKRDNAAACVYSTRNPNNN